MSTKMVFTINFKDENGVEEVKPITVETDIPDYKEFNDFVSDFNKLEKAVLKARKEVTEKALEAYMGDISKKKVYERNEIIGGEVKENERFYEITAEMGNLSCITHSVYRDNLNVFDISKHFFPALYSKEVFYSACYKELLCSFSIDESYRKAEAKINRVCWQMADGTQSRTIANIIEREGKDIEVEIDNMAKKILTDNGFSKEGEPIKPIKEIKIPPESEYISEDLISKAVMEYNKDKEGEKRIDVAELHETFENPVDSVNISVDEVSVKKQKEEGRSKYSAKKEGREYVRNTVVHVQNGKGKYILNKLGVMPALRILMAFLLHNGLLTKGYLVFFVDGAADIHSNIKKLFGWVPFKIILDWYHLIEKCKMQLSLGLNGRKIRNSVLEEISALLWVGKVEKAVEVLRKINPNNIKNIDAIKGLIKYFDRNWSYIPCYALRKKLGLRNSSNQGEKANDLTVSDRQKHNGMSWSKSGSSSLASVTTLHQNNEQINWLLKKRIGFKMVNKEVA